jgi:hypothetical protein
VFGLAGAGSPVPTLTIAIRAIIFFFVILPCAEQDS